MNILHDLAEALTMGVTAVPLYAALPVYLIGYGFAVWVIAKAIKAVKDIFKLDEFLVWLIAAP